MERESGSVGVIISVIMPAFNEENVIGEVVERVRSVMSALGYPYEIIVVDDGSGDSTAYWAREAGATVISHPYNIGNGASVKTGIRHAKGDVFVMLDGDGQHAPEDIPRLLERLITHDMVVGARAKGSQTSFHRDFANRIYNALASYVCGRKIWDLTSGFRAMKADLARGFVYLLPNGFSYPTTSTLATLRSGRSLDYVEVTTKKRVGKSKIRLLSDGVRFLMIILKIATFFSPLKIFIPTSAAMFLTGVGYGLFRIFAMDTSYGPTSALFITASILSFLVGLVSEQVAQLRLDRSEIVWSASPRLNGFAGIDLAEGTMKKLERKKSGPHEALKVETGVLPEG